MTVYGLLGHLFGRREPGGELLLRHDNLIRAAAPGLQARLAKGGLKLHVLLQTGEKRLARREGASGAQRMSRLLNLLPCLLGLPHVIIRGGALIYPLENTLHEGVRLRGGLSRRGRSGAAKLRQQLGFLHLQYGQKGACAMLILLQLFAQERAGALLEGGYIISTGQGLSRTCAGQESPSEQGDDVESHVHKASIFTNATQDYFSHVHDGRSISLLKRDIHTKNHKEFITNTLY